MKPLRSSRLPLRIVCVARLVEKKGLDQQLRIYAALRAAGIPFAARIVGDGPLRPALERLAGRLGVAADVTFFTGQVPHFEVWNQLLAADVLLHTGVIAPSGDRDGLANVIPEAMAIGVLVVTSPAAASTEAVTDGVSGLVIPVESPAAWVAALRRLSVDDELAGRLRAAARKWVEENSTPTATPPGCGISSSASSPHDFFRRHRGLRRAPFGADPREFPPPRRARRGGRPRRLAPVEPGRRPLRLVSDRRAFFRGRASGVPRIPALPALRCAAIFYDAIPLKHPHITWPQSVARHPDYLKLLAGFDHVLAISAASRSELVSYWQWLGVNVTPPVTLLALGADADRPPQARQEIEGGTACPQAVCYPPSSALASSSPGKTSPSFSMSAPSYGPRGWPSISIWSAG